MKRKRSEDLGVAADPATRDCDWCGDGRKADSAWEIYKPRKKVGTAQFLYACYRHEELARIASRAPERAA